MKNATMLYKAGGKHKIHGGYFDYAVVDAEEVEEKLKEGWHKTTSDAAEEVEEKPVPSDDKLPTRDELEQKAKELGIEFSANIGDKKLLERITEALKNSG